MEPEVVSCEQLSIYAETSPKKNANFLHTKKNRKLKLPIFYLVFKMRDTFIYLSYQTQRNVHSVWDAP